MIVSRRPLFRLLIAAGLFGLMGGAAQAQNCLGRRDFDNCMASYNNMLMRQNARAQEQNFQGYVATNQDWLKRNYAQHRAAGGRMTPQQFAHWGLMTANGTNVSGALEAQRRQFEGNQRAHQTVMQGYNSYNQGIAANSAATSATAQRYSEGAIRGNAPYVDPSSGKTLWLPYSAQAGRAFSSGGQTYVRDQTGTYYQQRGNGWVRMDQGR